MDLMWKMKEENRRANIKSTRHALARAKEAVFGEDERVIDRWVMFFCASMEARLLEGWEPQELADALEMPSA